MSICFHLKNLGHLKYFLGIEVAHNSNGFLLCQRKYVFDIINEVDVLGAKLVGFLLDLNHHLSLATEPQYSNPGRYQRLKGHLVYLIVTGQKLSYYVHMLDHFIPKSLKWNSNTDLHVVRYLKEISAKVFLFKLSVIFNFMSSVSFSWKIKRQRVISRSSTR